MGDGKRKKSSALNVRPGVEGGHDGLPGGADKRPGEISNGTPDLTCDAYVAGIRSGDRTVLARAITLIESNAPAHQEQAQAVLAALLPGTESAIRVGVTGVPGAGKSTLIETLGCRAGDGQIAAEHRLLDPR